MYRVMLRYDYLAPRYLDIPFTDVHFPRTYARDSDWGNNIECR